jgi:hypothetical protein
MVSDMLKKFACPKDMGQAGPEPVEGTSLRAARRKLSQGFLSIAKAKTQACMLSIDGTSFSVLCYGFSFGNVIPLYLSPLHPPQMTSFGKFPKKKK